MLPEKVPEVSVRTLLLMVPLNGMSCEPETQSVPGLLNWKTPLAVVPTTVEGPLR